MQLSNCYLLFQDIIRQAEDLKTRQWEKGLKKKKSPTNPKSYDKLFSMNDPTNLYSSSSLL